MCVCLNVTTITKLIKCPQNRSPTTSTLLVGVSVCVRVCLSCAGVCCVSVSERERERERFAFWLRVSCAAIAFTTSYNLKCQVIVYLASKLLFMRSFVLLYRFIISQIGTLLCFALLCFRCFRFTYYTKILKNCFCYCISNGGRCSRESRFL